MNLVKLNAALVQVHEGTRLSHILSLISPFLQFAPQSFPKIKIQKATEFQSFVIKKQANNC